MRDAVALSYTRDLLERITGVRPDLDEQGDLPVTVNGQRLWVTVARGQDVTVRVFAQVALDLDVDDPHLLRAINELNRGSDFAHWWLAGGMVSVAIDIWGDDINPANLGHACSAVARAAAKVGPELDERFGSDRHQGAPGPSFTATEAIPTAARPDAFTGATLASLPTLRAAASPYL